MPEPDTSENFTAEVKREPTWCYLNSRQACLEFLLKPISQMRATFGLIKIKGLDEILPDPRMKLELHLPPRRTPAQKGRGSFATLGIVDCLL
jgi:hypothetical protein